MRRLWKLLLALALVVALAVAVWFVLKPLEETPAAEPSETMIYSVDPAALTALRWSWADETLALVKENGCWVCTNAPETPIDQTAAENLAAQASSVGYRKLLDETEPSEFGFQSPRMTIQIYLGDTVGTLELGLRNDFAGGDYARYGSGSIYLIDTALYDAFAVRLRDLVPQDVLPSVSTTSIRRLNITTPEGGRTLVQPENYAELTYAQTYTWFEQRDGAYIALSSAAVSTVASAVTGVAFANCVAYRPADLAAYGLAEPVLSVSLAYQSSDSSGAVTEGGFTLHFGSYTTPAEPLVGGEDALEQLDAPAREVYVCLDGSDLVYTADAAVLETLLNALTDDLRPTDVCLINWETLRAIRATVDGVTTRMGIDRIEDRNDAGEIVTTTSYSVDGSESTYEEIYEVYRSIRYMKAEATVEEAIPEVEAYLTLEFHQDSDDYSVMSLRLYVYDASFYLVEFNGESRLLVSRRSVEALANAIRTLRGAAD